jgi:hypothetical protein
MTMKSDFGIVVHFLTSFYAPCQFDVALFEVL